MTSPWSWFATSAPAADPGFESSAQDVDVPCRRSWVPISASAVSDVGTVPSIVVGVARVNGDGRVVECDATFARLLHCFELEVVGAGLDEVLGVPFGSARTEAVVTADGTNVHIVMGQGDDGRRVVVASAGAGVTAPVPVPATLDELTSLGDRRSLNRRLEEWPPDVELALMLIDLDRFKSVNDTLGHGAGDKLLTLVADRLRSATRRDADQVFRLGGDEFVVVHAPLDVSSIDQIAGRIVEFLGRPFLIEGQQVNVGASIGIASSSGTCAPQTLLRHADLALYDAKSAGRGCFRHFRPVLADRASEQREREMRLRRALALGELSLEYQPQISVTEGRVCGFEALLRWDNPTLGRVPPLVFIPIAEETAEIHRIGEWVLTTACEEATRWPTELMVAVNVSAIQLTRPDFVDTVATVLRRYDLPPGRLEIEITETVLLDDTGTSLSRLHELRDLGVRIAMDDFGTGYSSLNYLNSFPFSSLKIDQSFVRGEQTARSSALLNAIVHLGSNLGMTTIAEGVETAQQYQALAAQGCAEVQGYFISRPIPPTQITEFLGQPLPTT